jgi:hypothetical protein
VEWKKDGLVKVAVLHQHRLEIEDRPNPDLKKQEIPIKGRKPNLI